MTDQDKELLLNGTATVPTELEILPSSSSESSISLTEDDIIDWNYEDFRYVPDKGWIGQFVARKLTAQIKNPSDNFKVENKELILKFAVKTDEFEHWYSLGNFLVTQITDGNVKDITNIECYDYTQKFNQPYVDSITYPCTALQLAQNVCQQAGVTLGSSSFKKSDYVITGNVFTNGESLRDVMCAIGKLAFSWIRIGWDNEVYIDFEKATSVDNYNKINNSKYYTLETQNENYGYVNRIVIGYSQIDGEQTKIEDQASIEQYGLCELDIFDNPLVYTQAQRESIISQAQSLLGLVYRPSKLETVGHPWLLGKELVQVTDMEGNTFNTYAFDRTIKYFGHIKTLLESKATTSLDSRYAYEPMLEKQFRNAEARVDKELGRIALTVNQHTVQIGELETDINPTDTATGTSLELSRSGGNDLIEFIKEGNYYQKTLSGKNLIPFTNQDFTLKNVRYYVIDGSIYFNGTSTGETSSADVMFKTNFSFYLDAGTYYFNRGNTNTASYIKKYSDNTNLATNSGSFTLTEQTQVYLGFYVYNQTFDNLKPEMYLVAGSTSQEYEPYCGGIPSPSPQFQEEAVMVEGYNLLNINGLVKTTYGQSANGEIIDNIIKVSYTSSGTYKYASWRIDNVNKWLGKRLFFSCDIYRSGGNNARILFRWFNDNEEVIGTLADFTQNTGYIEIPSVLPSSATTILISFYSNVDGSYQSGDYIEYSNILISDKQYPYVPYGCIGYRAIGKNLLPFKNQDFTLNNVRYYITDGSIYFNGVSTGETSSANAMFKSNFSFDLPSGTYYFNNGNTNTASYIKMYSDNSDLAINSGTFTLQETTKVYLGFYVYQQTFNNLNPKMYLIRGTSQTEYKPHQEVIVPIDLLGTKIAKLPDGTRDMLRYENRHLYIDKYVEKRIFDGTEDWQLYNSTSADPRRYGLRETGLPQDTLFISNYFTRNLYANRLNNDLQMWVQTDYWAITDKNSFWQTANDLKSWLSTHNPEVWYKLDEPQIIDLGEYDLPTTEDTCYIDVFATLDSDMYCKYALKSNFKDVYQTKDGMKEYLTKTDTISEIKVATDNISSSVGELTTVVNGNGENISSIQNQVNNLQTSTKQQINVINTTLENGVEKVTNSLVKIDINGINVSRNNETMNTQITNKAFISKDGNKELAFFGYDETEQKTIARIRELETEVASFGCHRVEKYTESGANRTGFFWFGGIR